jgi:DNA-binding PadR family transcriptional regulator
MASIHGDRLRGHLEGLILAALERGTAHGWEVWHRLEAASSGALALKEGSLYPALYRLERQGLIAARWEAATTDRPGPRRRVYRLTPKGRRRLDSARDEWRHFVTVLGSLLGAPA